jgi:hypothetical protein
VNPGGWRGRRTFVIGLAIAIGTGLSGCGWSGSASRTLYEDPTLRVSLEADPAVGAHRSPPNDHPVTFESAQMILLLKGVEVERPPGFLKSLVFGPKREPAFSQEEILALAPRVSEALRQAVSTERVSFALSSVSNSKTRELTTGRIWVQGKGFHLLLEQYRMPEGGRKSDIPEPYQSSYSRGPRTPQTVIPDFSVLFSPSSYMIPRESSLKAEMLASPETEVVVDYPRLFSEATKRPQTVQAERGQDGAARVNTAGTGFDGSHMSPQEGRIPANTVDPDSSQSTVQILTERVKALETEVTSLLDIVKRLSGSLEEARKTSAAKDEQIQMLLRGSPPSLQKPKPSVKGRSGDRDKSPAP